MNLFSLDAGILIICETSKIEDVLFEHGELPHVHVMSIFLLTTWNVLGWQVEGTILRHSYSLTFLWNPSFMHESEEVVVVGGGLQDF